MSHFLKQHRCAPLVLIILITIATTPLYGNNYSWTELILVVIRIVFVAAAALLLKATPIWHRAFLILALLATGCMLIQILTPRTIPSLNILLLISAALIEIITLALLLRHSFSEHGATPSDRIMSAVAGYFMLAMIWANFYAIILIHQPDAIIENATQQPVENRQLSYFSLITLTTQGFGDILPKSTLARMTAGFEGAVGTVYLAVLIASLIGIIHKEKSPLH